MTMESAKRTLTEGLQVTLAGIFLVETWFWDHGKIALQALARREGAATFEARLRNFIAGLSALSTFLVFLAPAALMLPLIEAALALMGAGYVLLGIAVLLIGQAIVLGATAFLFDLCRDKLFQMTWFALLDGLVLRARSRAEDWVAPVWARRREGLVFVRNHAEAALGREKLRCAEKWESIRTLVARKAVLRRH